MPRSDPSERFQGSSDQEYIESRVKEMSKSKVPYHTPIHREPENYHRRPEPDRADDMAIRADFDRTNPDLDTIERRGKYRQHLDFRCLPEDQNFMVITTYGPTDQYDIKADKSGFYCWGVFATELDAVCHISMIREVNPHAVFVAMHILQLGGRIDLPPPNDGNTEQHYLNQDYQKFMKRHLHNEVKNSKQIFQRKRDAIEQGTKRNDAVEEYNAVQQSLEEISGSILHGKDEQVAEIDKVLKSFPPYVGGRNPDAKTVTPGNMPFEQCLENLEYVPAHLVKHYIKCYEASANDLPPSHKISYRQYTRKDGRVAIVRVISIPKMKKNNS